MSRPSWEWRSYTINLAMPLILLFLLLLALGVIPFTAPWVAAGILISSLRVDLTITR